ncbi:AAA family ATPase [Anaerocolumna sedimenticola]|uniref:AAA family ATPase n=1 Tax=Anaerocolumna sedimenticola TaxID=2696063 RepID=A0A6P1TRB8_9FIRM|nr:3'-5' exonuclease [Anaerocolumna sedimenticola]QHQ62782.1 AAA family ATPase [Anaerocolumna sedimenticola]
MTNQTERLLEEQYLNSCISIIKKNIDAYKKEIEIMSADIEDMYDRYRHDDPEIFTELSNTITMNENMKTALRKNRRALKKPYFGRIDIKDHDMEEETFYIGKGGVMKDATTIMVVDWRAPLANVYYENGLGECSYIAPDKIKITIDLKKKRTFEIDGEKLIDYFDSEVVTNDDLLTKYLAKNKEAVLGEIIATIQKEQNDIIRKSPYRNMIVQGVAGSGKTTVAMHRISYILYNYAEDFKPEDFYIIGSNRILLNYITGVLPDLDVHGVKQMTMEQLFIRLLYEDWNEKKYKVIPCDKRNYRKGTYDWFQTLEEFCSKLEAKVIPQEDIYLNDKLLYSSEQIKGYIEEGKRLSIQTKIDGLNQRVLNKLKNEITGREITYTPEMKKQLVKDYTKRFGEKKWKVSIYDLYSEFLIKQKEIWHEDIGIQEMNVSMKEFDVYDLAALAYLYKRVKETDPIREAHHIVVDEAQDFGMMAYSVLHYCIPNCSFTIMGDVSQNIHFGYGLHDWEELKDLILTDRFDNFGILSKSYRNTVEISNFAQKILQKGSFSSYPIEPIIRHGEEVSVTECHDEKDMLNQSARIIEKWQQEGYDTIAVVCRNAMEAELVAKNLGKRITIEESDLEKAEFKKGVMVLPVEYTKGLEFDTVLIYNPTSNNYPEDDGHAKLLYVAATRALHELTILHAGAVTKLI